MLPQYYFQNSYMLQAIRIILNVVAKELIGENGFLKCGFCCINQNSFHAKFAFLIQWE